MSAKDNNFRKFLVLWSTQGLSQLGSAITTFGLTLWLFEKTGSALSTATLSICSYAPYILTSIFAGAIIDRLDKKKVMLVCDILAAVSTIVVLVLYKTDALQMWHLYAINVFAGLMNSLQQPASEVAITLLIPKDKYQKASALQSLSRSTISILNPLIAAGLYAVAGLELCILVDLCTFLVAFCALLFAISLPEMPQTKTENVLTMAKEGLSFLKKTPLVFSILLFMSGVNLVASAFDATLPALVIPNPKGGQAMLGVVTSCAGVAMIIGSFIAGKLPKPKNRVRVIYITMLFSLGTENFLLAFSREPIVWCIGQIIGWILVPIMSANEEVILRRTIPIELQGRVYACRNTFQYFTIPIGLFWGGLLTDSFCEPFMIQNANVGWLTFLFGTGKGSGAALMMFILGVLGIVLCLVMGKIMNRYSFVEEDAIE